MTSEEAFQYHVLLEGMREGVLAVDSEYRIKHLNSSGARLLKISAEEALGRDIRQLLPSHPILPILDDVWREGRTQEAELRIEHPREIYLQTRGQPLKSAGGKQSGAMLVFSDVTRIRILEDHRRTFVSNVSHELRTPLTTIQGFVETLLDGAYKREDELLNFLGIIKKHSQRLGVIIEDLLTLSKLESEASDDLLSRQKILSVLNHAQDTCKELAEKKKISVLIECPLDLEAKINTGLMSQAVINLLDNAIKYSEEGSLVKLTALKSGKTVQIVVEDNGPGIEEKHLDRLFERFYRVDKARSRKVGGTGLGLSIVKHIALAHNGNVKVESKLGSGSRFSLELPAIS